MNGKPQATVSMRLLAISQAKDRENKTEVLRGKMKAALYQCKKG